MSKALRDFLNYFGQEQDPYPWALTTEAIAPDLEMSLSPEEEADLDERSERFFASLETLSPSEPAKVTSKTLDNLLSRLSQWLPQDQCTNVVKICQAQCLVATEYRDQLALAIAELLPQWNSDDRQILMRNYAGAFRSRTASRSLAPKADKVWDEMSAVEQGQYLVAIADVVLTELNELDEESDETNP